MANLRVDKITSTETFETTGSVQFDGTTGQLTVSGSDSATTYDFGTDDFTIEFWRYKSTSSVESYVARLDTAGGSATSDFWFGNVNGVDGFYYYEGSTGRNISTESQPLNTWAHLAVVRYNNYLTLYLNGKEVARKSHSAAFNNGSANLRIGGDDASSGNTNYPLEGFLSNVRITKKALYTSNFKPSMRELEVLPETILLACQSKTDASLEKTGKTLVVGGTPVACELTPGILTPIVKSGGGSAITGSVEFNGGGAGQNISYLQFPSADDDLILSGDFTIELWIRPGSIASSGSFHIFANQAQDTTFQYSNSDTNVIVYDGSNRTLGSLDKGEWAHVAIVRSGSTLQAYKNGNKFGASWTNSSTTRYTFSSTLLGGRWQTGNNFDGFISNFRVNKGTALYTDDFIPPTRELKNVPGTVLLCCQDSNNPLTEATGKTITGYGNLQRADGPELVTNGYFDNGTTGWSVTGGAIVVTSGQLQLTNSNTTLGKVDQTITTVVGQIYQVSALITPDGGGHFPRLYVGADDFTPVLSSTNIQQLVTVIHTAVSTSTVISLNSNTNNANAVTLFDDVSAYDISYDADAPASNFTPQVGDDRQITFEGVTKINTDAYFYLPTGDTVTRDSRSGRGVRAGGYSGTTNATIEYFNIAYEGESREFGDLTVARETFGGCSSSTRGLFAAGNPGSSPNNTDNIDFITFSNTANAIDFGNLGQAKRGIGSCSNQTRGIFAGGDQPGNTNIIDFVNIATTGNTRNFGDLTVVKSSFDGCSSPIRAIFGGGNNPSATDSDVIDYVTIASKGNALDFGNLTDGRRNITACSSSTRAIFGGGRAPGLSTIIDYVTIASTGDASDFGDLTVARNSISGVSNDIRGVFQGGSVPSVNATIDFVTIASTGNATAWGTLKAAAYGLASASDSHGGLG